MDTQNTSVHPHAQSRIDGKNHPSHRARAKGHPGGVTHDNSRHTARFTVIGNHLAQHPDLSLLAIGLACHIQDLALATLSAITHATHPEAGAILKSMTTVLRDTPQSIAGPIIEVIAQGLGKHPAAQLWRKLVAVDLSFYKSPLSEEIRDEGRAEGRVEGEARRAAEDVLDILDVRGIDVPDAVRERITGCGDPELLRHWHRRAVTAPTAEDVLTDE
ncbi:hypothetical protein ACH4CD_17915 [Streptomyces fungicidicus]|uniref:hypothetical protein n=1 Tax=Streptomyces fungicidicus TaxID=68203 RepID=UPI0037ACBF02